MPNKKQVSKAATLLKKLCKLGFFNSLLLLGVIGLYFLWFFVFSRETTGLCSCVPIAGFLFLPELFPEEMPRTYLLNWVYAFLSITALEFLTFSGFMLKASLTKVRLLLIPFFFPLAFIHNLPGAFLILTIMSQPAYFSYYFTAFLLSLPLLFLYRLFPDFQQTGPIENKQVFWHQPLWGLSHFALLYLILSFISAPSMLFLPVLAFFEWRFLFHPLMFFLMLWVYQWATRKRITKQTLP